VVTLTDLMRKKGRKKSKSKGRSKNPSQSPINTFYPTLKTSNYGFKKYMYGKNKGYKNQMFPKVRKHNHNKYKF